MKISTHGILGSQNVSGPTVLVPGDGTTNWTASTNIITGLGFVFANGGATGFNKGASFGTAPISTDFTFVADINTTTGSHVTGANAYIGVSNVDPDNGFTSMLFSFQTYWGVLADTRIYTSESGTRIGGIRSTFSIGDTLKIERVGTTITYYLNATLLYTSLVSSSTIILVDTSFNNVGFKYENISLTY